MSNEIIDDIVSVVTCYEGEDGTTIIIGMNAEGQLITVYVDKDEMRVETVEIDRIGNLKNIQIDLDRDCENMDKVADLSKKAKHKLKFKRLD